MKPRITLPELSSRKKFATTRDRISIAFARLVVPPIRSFFPTGLTYESKKLNTIQ